MIFHVFYLSKGHFDKGHHHKKGDHHKKHHHGHHKAGKKGGKGHKKGSKGDFGKGHSKKVSESLACFFTTKHVVWNTTHSRFFLDEFNNVRILVIVRLDDEMFEKDERSDAEG